MAKIVDEPKILRYDVINGEKIPVYSAKVETTVTNTKTGQEYTSHEDCQADIDNPDTDTTEFVSLRGRGREFTVNVVSNTTGTAWRLGTQRFDIQPDGRR